MPQTLADYAQLHLSLGDETAFVSHRGFRTLRWSYRQIAELAFRVARELESRTIFRARLRSGKVVPTASIAPASTANISWLNLRASVVADELRHRPEAKALAPKRSYFRTPPLRVRGGSLVCWRGCTGGLSRPTGRLRVRGVGWGRVRSGLRRSVRRVHWTQSGSRRLTWCVFARADPVVAGCVADDLVTGGGGGGRGLRRQAVGARARRRRARRRGRFPIGRRRRR